MGKLTDHSFFNVEFQTTLSPMFGNIDTVIRRLHDSSKKRRTDPFQIFCVKNRADLTAQNPDEPVGAITSRLAQRWRSMDSDQKSIYVELARQFDQTQTVTIRPRKPRPREPPDVEFPLPRIHIVRRGESGTGVEIASLNSFTHTTEA
jgi:hypothetical protein